MKLETGDLLFVKSGTFLGKAISSVSNFDYSHVALVLDENSIVEVTAFTKSKIISLSELDYEQVLVKRPYKSLGTREKELIVTNANALLNKRYDYSAIALLLMNYLFGLNVNPFKSTLKRIYCCELVDYLYETASINLVPHNENHIVKVEELFNSRELYTVGLITA